MSPTTAAVVVDVVAATIAVVMVDVVSETIADSVDESSELVELTVALTVVLSVGLVLVVTAAESVPIIPSTFSIPSYDVARAGGPLTRREPVGWASGRGFSRWWGKLGKVRR